MQCYTDKIKSQLQQIALIKQQRTLDGMSISFCDVFSLLPALIHYHHPALPGYVDGAAPCGIYNYLPASDVVQTLKQQFDVTIEPQDNAEYKISALYSMGSTCSLGQSIYSDLDIWVCVEDSLSDKEKQLLGKKCRLIEKWAESKGVELTLFIVDANRFKDNHHECLIGDNCGSAQHILLLEEFYRTANLLAGKLLLWYVIPSSLMVNNKKYASYDEYIDELVNLDIIKREEWIDFGSIIELSAAEYFGASLWQLYKSLDSPFKAVLKTLLLETYSWQYPKHNLIATQMKALIQSGNIGYHYLDSYYMMLETVTHYLTSIGDKQRLKLARSCFYLKVNEKLSESNVKPSWRRQILTELVKSWQWSDEYIASLDSHRSWKIEQVREINDILLQTMMTGYRNLLNFGRRNNLDSLVSPQDLSILTRKLYASYEVLPGKISVINTKIATDLSEKALTFIHVRNDRINRVGWYLFNQKPNLDSIIGHQYLEYSDSLVKLVGWCYFNSLISDQTEIYCRDNGDNDATKLRQLIADLKSYFPIAIPAPTEEALYGPCEIKNLAIMINLKHDNQYDPNLISPTDGSFDANVLNYGNRELCLIRSIDLLYRNSWNEIRVIHFSNDLCVLDAIRTLLNRMHKDADLPDSLEIFCYSKYLQSEIKQQMQVLMDRCIEYRLSTTKNNSRQLMPLRINGSSWYLFFERFGVTAHQFNNSIDFYDAVSNSKIQGRALNILDEANDLPKEIDSFASQGVIQFFFEDTDVGFNLYILNENNQVEIYRNCNGNKQNMVKDINSFYALSDDRFTFSSGSSVNFNLPQFYHIFYNEQNKREIAPLNTLF